jgi:hypothetical protein
MITFKYYLNFFIFLALYVCSLTVSAQDYHWAGVGFMGDYSKRSILYPYSSEVFDDLSCSNVSCFEVFSRKVFKNQSIAGGKIKFTQAEPGTNAIGVALAISYERLIVDKTPSSQYTNKNTLNTIAIFGNILFMDLDTNKLVGAVPTYIRYTVAESNQISDQTMQSIVKEMLTSNSLKLNFASDALRRAKKYSLPSDKILRAQVTEFRSSKDARKALGNNPQEMEFLTMQMAQIFEGALMNETGLQMLPSSIGHIVGGKLKTRLSSGDRTINLPDPDYSVRVDLSKLGKFQKRKKNGTGDTICHAVRINFSVEDSFRDNVFKTSLKNMRCLFYRKGTQTDDQASYEKSLLALLSNTAKALDKPNNSDDFYKKSAPKAKRAFAALHKMLFN